MSEIDESTLRKIAKRYSKAVNVGNWEVPDEEVVNNVRQLLIMNKDKTIQLLPNRKRLIGAADTEIQDFIDLFVQRLGADSELDEERWLKLPAHLDKNDFNYDYQLQKLQFLKNLYLNECKLVGNLKTSVAAHSTELRSWEKALVNYKKAYAEELALNKDITVQKEGNTDITGFGEIETDDTELLDILGVLEMTAGELLDKTQDLAKIADILDEINETLP